MRYTWDESTNILGIFDSGATVTITIYKLSDNTKVVDGAVCTEVDNTGVFKYEFSYAGIGKEEFLWIMTDGNVYHYGKLVFGGYVNKIHDIRKITINKVLKEGNIITVYEDDGTTIWKRFDLTQGREEI